MEQETKLADAVQEVQAQTNETTTKQEIQDTPEQVNWKKFREEREIARQKQLEAEKKANEKAAEAAALKAAMEAILNKPSQASQGSYQDQSDETEEMRVKRLVSAAIQERDKVQEAEMRRRESQELPQRLAQIHPDFNHVCTAENLDYLEYHYPEVVAGYKNAPDGMDKWSNIYKLVKRFIPNHQSAKDEKKVDKNFHKPQSMSVPGTTTVGDNAPSILDDKKRANNWSRMQKVMKGG